MAKSRPQSQAFDIIGNSSRGSRGNPAAQGAIKQEAPKEATLPREPALQKRASIVKPTTRQKPSEAPKKRETCQKNMRLYADQVIPLTKLALDEGYKDVGVWARDLFDEILKDKGYL